jgi:hypothetical protein
MLFQIHPYMFDDDDKAERAKMMAFADELIRDRQSIIAERRDFILRESDDVLAKQREVIKGKTAEEIKKEYGFIEGVDLSNVDQDKIPNDFPLEEEAAPA